MIRSIGVTGLALLVGLTTQASAQGLEGLPEYDVEKHCKQQAAMMGGSNFMLQACQDQEQSSYDELKKDWASVDPKIKRTCREQTRIVMPSYFMLNACVAQEVASKEAAGNFKFRK